MSCTGIFSLITKNKMFSLVTKNKMFSLVTKGNKNVFASYEKRFTRKNYLREKYLWEKIFTRKNAYRDKMLTEIKLILDFLILNLFFFRVDIMAVGKNIMWKKAGMRIRFSDPDTDPGL